MDFCSSCGFLLPLELVADTSTKCKACSFNSEKIGKCECDLCKTSITVSVEKRQENKSSNNTRTCENSLESTKIINYNGKKNKSKRSWKVNDKTKTMTNYDYNYKQYNSEYFSENQYDFIPDWATATEHLLDWSEPSFERWDDRNCNNTWDETFDRGDIQASPLASLIQNELMNNDDDFYVNTQDTTSETVKKKKLPRYCDFPPLDRDLKEYQVAELIRADWERQQECYKRMIVLEDGPGIAKLVSRKIKRKDGCYVGGVDISFIKDNGEDACACLCVVRLPDLKLVYQAMEMVKLTEPYIPGFLAFREVPFFIDLLTKLKTTAPQFYPNVIMVDGNGILHPRGFGLASQLGVVTGIPTIGVAKTLMTAQGIVDDAIHKDKKRSLQEAGHGFDLISDDNQILGKCLRVHDKAPNPVYVSVGHKISLKSAVWLVLECSKYRIPEPIRRADLDSREYIRQGKTEPEVYFAKSKDMYSP